MMPFPKPVFVCLCGRFVVGLPVSYDTGSLNLADLVHLPTPDSQTLSEAFWCCLPSTSTSWPKYFLKGKSDRVDHFT